MKNRRERKKWEDEEERVGRERKGQQLGKEQNERRKRRYGIESTSRKLRRQAKRSQERRIQATITNE
jgi:hypothetical protein